MLVISNRPHASQSSDFEITRAITPWIVLHSVQLLLLGTLRYTTASCYYGYFGREGLGWQLRFLRKPPANLKQIKILLYGYGCSASTCLYKNGYVRLYSSFIRQRLDQWQWFPSLVSILRLPEIRFASQLLLQRTWIPTTKQNNTDKKLDFSTDRVFVICDKSENTKLSILIKYSLRGSA